MARRRNRRSSSKPSSIVPLAQDLRRRWETLVQAEAALPDLSEEQPDAQDLALYDEAMSAELTLAATVQTLVEAGQLAPALEQLAEQMQEHMDSYALLCGTCAHLHTLAAPQCTPEGVWTRTCVFGLPIFGTPATIEQAMRDDFIERLLVESQFLPTPELARVEWLAVARPLQAMDMAAQAEVVWRLAGQGPAIDIQQLRFSEELDLTDSYVLIGRVQLQAATLEDLEAIALEYLGEGEEDADLLAEQWERACQRMQQHTQGRVVLSEPPNDLHLAGAAVIATHLQSAVAALLEDVEIMEAFEQVVPVALSPSEDPAQPWSATLLLPGGHECVLDQIFPPAALPYLTWIEEVSTMNIDVVFTENLAGWKQEIRETLPAMAATNTPDALPARRLH